MPSRPTLYNSAIQYVLVLQEESEDPSTTPLPLPTLPIPPPSPSSQWGTSPTPKLPPPSQSTPPSQADPASDNSDNDHPPPSAFPWRVPERLRTTCGALILCLNVGVKPPEATRPMPRACQEAWVVPNVANPIRSTQAISKSLKDQYEQCHDRTKCKVAQDPTVPELRKMCVTLRKSAKAERVLFHYNGHGVPRPTANGEIWVFSHNFTQYIPLSLFDLNSVLGGPSLYVFDCNSAGTIQNHLTRIMAQLERDWQAESRNPDKTPKPPHHRASIILSSCKEGEVLPSNPDLPADLFTSCLTTPIKTVLRWFAARTLVSNITPELIDRLPGDLHVRKTPLGELFWIFTAVTDAIAWNVLPSEQFKMLHRQDLMVSSLMRNFLLSQRIMRSHGCTPVSHPWLPETHTHPLWHAFDLAMEQTLSQLPQLVAAHDAQMAATCQDGYMSPPESPVKKPNGPTLLVEGASAPSYTYIPSTFFDDQLKAFDVWLNLGPEGRGPPEQLPIMLQVLLSDDVHRVQALRLLSRYLQTGAFAVDRALSVGIFPYIVRLLRSHSREIRQELIFIWSKILALDNSCRHDLVKEGGEKYFVQFLSISPDPRHKEPQPVYLAVAMFVLSVIAKDYADSCRAAGAMEVCFSRLTHESPFVRRWACLCLTKMVECASPPAQTDTLAWEELLTSLRQIASSDISSDVRAAATATLSAILGGVLKIISPKDDNENSTFTSHDASQPIPEAGDPNVTDFQSDGASGVADSNFTMPPSVRSLKGATPVSPSNTAADEKPGKIPESREGPLECQGQNFAGIEVSSLLGIGDIIADIGRQESSPLVRREVALCINATVGYQHERFVHAAHVTDVTGVENSPYTNDDSCDVVYRKLWSTLSELAFDPHPIVAKLARRSYDSVSETLLRRIGPLPRYNPTLSNEENPATDHTFSPRNSSGRDFLMGDRLGFDERQQSGTGSSTSILGQSPNLAAAGQDVAGKSPGTAPSNAQGGHGGLLGSNTNVTNSGIPPLSGGGRSRHSSGLASRQGSIGDRKWPMPSRSPDGLLPTGSIRVRSTSGSFDLPVSSRLPYMSKMPRVNSASLLMSSANLESEKVTENHRLTASVGDHSRENGGMDEDGSPSLPHIAIAKGVGNLMKTVSQQLNLGGFATSPNARPRSSSSTGRSAEAREHKDEKELKTFSPPRPPKRSLSYQVLNATAALLPDGELPTFTSSRPTYFSSAGHNRQEETSKEFSQKLPQAYRRLYLSAVGDAALSLYEWSSAYISRVQFDATTTDSVNEIKPIPRFAALWDKMKKSSGKIPSEGLRAFALLGEGEKRSTGISEDEGEDFKNAIEISSRAMGAGGGAVVAMAFLPRDIGMGDDQLIATGDSTGSVGVYDIRSGKCQGSFGIPCAPGTPEVGVNAILCLNRPTPDTAETYGSVANSRSALILAGAFDGRVAIFKSACIGPKYHIMSTFQASGQSYWSKIGTRRESRRRPSQNNMMRGTDFSSGSLESIHSTGLTYAETVRDSGNGLVLAFDSDSDCAHLGAGGCDMETVRVWDLERERCVWQGFGVGQNTWPTAISMWGRINPCVFVVGSSEGMISMIDMRDRVMPGLSTNHMLKIGQADQPVISLGTCPPVGKNTCDSVVSADIGGMIAFWDPRRGSNSTGGMDTQSNVSRLELIKAHQSNLTAMVVHPEGKVIASGSTARCVKVFSSNRKLIKKLNSHGPEPNLSDVNNRIPPVTSLSFQPESSLLGIGCMDSSVIIYGQPDSFPGVQAPLDEMRKAEQRYENWR